MGNSIYRMQQPCSQCRGQVCNSHYPNCIECRTCSPLTQNFRVPVEQGEYADPSDICGQCSGHGVTNERASLTVTV